MIHDACCCIDDSVRGLLLITKTSQYQIEDTVEGAGEERDRHEELRNQRSTTGAGSIAGTVGPFFHWSGFFVFIENESAPPLLFSFWNNGIPSSFTGFRRYECHLSATSRTPRHLPRARQCRCFLRPPSRARSPRSPHRRPRRRPAPLGPASKCRSPRQRACPKQPGSS